MAESLSSLEQGLRMLAGCQQILFILFYMRG